MIKLACEKCSKLFCEKLGLGCTKEPPGRTPVGLVSPWLRDGGRKTVLLTTDGEVGV